MQALFLKLLNTGITAGWLVLAVVVLRFLLKKAPKALIVSLWALVGIRLVCPFSIESVFSLIPSAQTVPPEILVSEAPVIQSGIPAINAAVNPVLSEVLAPAAGASVKPAQSAASIASVIWLAGFIAILTYGAFSYLRLRRQVTASLLLQKNVYLCDHIPSPFILGVFRPHIYLPSGMTEEQTRYVIAHEKAHLKRKDHLWKPIGFLLLSVYWFHPALWLAYYLLCRDIEFACDEKVIREMNGSDKKGYSETLVSCGTGRRRILACPLAFGEIDVKARIKSVLHYKKPAFWIILPAIILTCVVAIAFLTDPVTKAGALSATDPTNSTNDGAQPPLPTEPRPNIAPIQDPGKDIPFTAAVSWVNYHEGGELYNSSLNVDRLYHFSSTYPADIPILKLDSAADLAQVKSELWDVFTLDYDYEGIPSFVKVTAAMDDAFFADNTVLLLYITAPSGSQRFRPCSVRAHENTLAIEILRENTSEPGTADMAGWFVTVTVAKSALKDITSFVADIGFRYGDEFDEWGLRMDLSWQSATEFDVTFTHSSQWASAAGTPVTTARYEIRAVYNGETISFGDYMRHVLHRDYVDAEIDYLWNAPTYPIQRDGTATFHVDPADTYGALPVGEYVLCKTVTLRADTGEDILTKIYTARFSVVE